MTSRLGWAPVDEPESSLAICKSRSITVTFAPELSQSSAILRPILFAPMTATRGLTGKSVATCPKIFKIRLKLVRPVVATAILSFGTSIKSPSGTMLFSPSRLSPTINGMPPSICVEASRKVLNTTLLALLVTSNSMMYASCPKGITSSIEDDLSPECNLLIAPSSGFTTWLTFAHSLKCPLFCSSMKFISRTLQIESSGSALSGANSWNAWFARAHARRFRSSESVAATNTDD